MLLLIQLFLVIFSLYLGYYFKSNFFNIEKINKFLSFLIFFILLAIGYETGAVTKNLFSNLLESLYLVFVFTIILFIFNVAGCCLIFRKSPSNTELSNSQSNPKSKVFELLRTYIFDSLKYILCIFWGILLGDFLKVAIPMFDIMVDGILVCILFIIGYQLKQQNITLRSVLMNKQGILIAISIIFSSIVAAIIVSFIVKLPIKNCLLLSSGFGWYTLSPIIVNQYLNQTMGTTVFFIDFIREMLAIILIPFLGRIHKESAVGYAAATSADFTLPILKVNLGGAIVPIAISSGLFLTVLTPILLNIWGMLL